ncbi:MAG: hypothetical protein JNL32_01175 [Candidatus Kapabacteria bacterium]|nr:hypothetical protein [Candidatus Kapabacteria bacterium]
MSNKKKKQYRPHGLRDYVAKNLRISVSAVDARLRNNEPEAVELAAFFIRAHNKARKQAAIIAAGLKESPTPNDSNNAETC